MRKSRAESREKRLSVFCYTLRQKSPTKGGGKEKATGSHRAAQNGCGLPGCCCCLFFRQGGGGATRGQHGRADREGRARSPGQEAGGTYNRKERVIKWLSEIW